MSPGSAHSLSIQCFLFYSVQLARRVLKLERINASLRQQLGTEEKDKNTLIEEVREGERDMLFPLCFIPPPFLSLSLSFSLFIQVEEDKVTV